MNEQLIGDWREGKTGHKGPMPFHADHECYLLVLFHSWACYILDGGDSLVLAESSPVKCGLRWMYPAFINMSNGVHASAKATRILKSLGRESRGTD